MRWREGPAGTRWLAKLRIQWARGLLEDHASGSKLEHDHRFLMSYYCFYMYKHVPKMCIITHRNTHKHIPNFHVKSNKIICQSAHTFIML